MLTLEGTTMHRQMTGMHNKSLCFQLQWKNAIEEENLFAFRKRKILLNTLFLDCDISPEVGWRNESFVHHSTHCGNIIAKLYYIIIIIIAKCCNVHTNRRNLCPILYCPKQNIQKTSHTSVTDCMCLKRGLTNVWWLTVCASQMFSDWLYVPQMASQMFGDWLYVPQMASQMFGDWLYVPQMASQMFGDWLYVPQMASQMFGDWL